MKKLSVLLLVLASFFSFSCDNNKTSILEREDLFSINYGNFEDQINLSKIDSGTYSATNICLNNGIFYISNSLGKKVLKTSFYGDLLSLYYNSEVNPHPSFLQKLNENGQAVENHSPNTSTSEASDPHTHPIGTRTAIEYPFNNCTFLTVSDIEHLYVVDTVPNERIQFDSDENIALMNVVLHFDEKGNLVDYIGQEGLGGTPFPNIISLSNNAENDLIVVCRTLSYIKVFWFSQDGILLSRIYIDLNSLPSNYDSDINLYTHVDAVFPSYELSEVFIKLDYYVESYDAETGVNIGVNYDKSSIYKVTLFKGEFEHMQDIFSYKHLDELDNVALEKVYMLKNICKNDWAFLMAQVDNYYAVQLLNLQSGKVKNIRIDVSDFDLVYNTFSVTKDSMLAALFADDDKAFISVWHTEDFLR